MWPELEACLDPATWKCGFLLGGGRVQTEHLTTATGTGAFEAHPKDTSGTWEAVAAVG